MQQYISQIIVPEIGKQGQRALMQASVLIVGAGGLGIPLATYLAAMGLGKLGIMDGDNVAINNLHRQFQYQQEDIGKPKASVLVGKIQKIQPGISINVLPTFLNTENIEASFSDYDLICDCTDNITARLLLNKGCKKYHKPLFFASARDWQGQITILHGKQHIDLSDIFSEQILTEEQDNTCALQGIVSPVCGVVGSLQAIEVVKWIINQESRLDGQMLCIDMLKNIFRFFKIKPLRNMYIEQNKP